MNQMMNRRLALNWLRGLGTVLLVGWLPRKASAAQSTPVPSTAIAALPGCVVRPEQTEGPYFVDEKLNRSDIRSNPADGSVQAGVPLKLGLQVSRMNGNQCQPLRGAIVDIWHTNALGVYSDVADRSFNTTGQKFLRGYQTTDATGTVQFLTIYPGWYPGRTVHIHFKVRTVAASGQSYEFTSQLYFDDALTDRVHAQPPYAQKGQRTLRNNRDGIFQQGGDQLTLAIAPASQGYTATFALALQMT